MRRIIGAVLFNAWFYGTGALTSLAAVPVALISVDGARVFAKLWIRAVLWGLRHFCGVVPVIQDQGRLAQTGAALYACQHQSALDTLIMMLVLPRACFVLKRELLRIPVFGWLLSRVGMIAVDRDAGAAAMRTMLTEARARIDSGMQIVIFPEGTRAAFGAPIILQPGIAGLARTLGLDVIPIATDSGRRWGRKAFFKTPGPVHVRVGESLPGRQSRHDLLAALHAHFSQDLDQPPG